MSSTASILFLVIAFVWKLAEQGQLRYWLIAAFTCFFVSAFWAWRQQYRENQIGRDVGSLAFEGLLFGANWHEELADLQVKIMFKNLKPRLLKYSMESYKFTMGSQQASQRL